jgi:hypothetical protein
LGFLNHFVVNLDHTNAIMLRSRETVWTENRSMMMMVRSILHSGVPRFLPRNQRPYRSGTGAILSALRSLLQMGTDFSSGIRFRTIFRKHDQVDSKNSDGHSGDQRANCEEND